jgi:ketosteroid isomerase-like protein
MLCERDVHLVTEQRMSAGYNAITMEATLYARSRTFVSRAFDLQLKLRRCAREHNAEALEKLLMDDTVFEDTSSPPDGRRIEGRANVMALWRDWFARNPDARFDAEEVIVSGDRAVTLDLSQAPKRSTRHLRGVDIFTVRDGKIAAKLAYVKG